jgi:hypothetical protein
MLAQAGEMGAVEQGATAVSEKRTVKFGEVVATLTDPDNIPIALVEAIVEARVWNGVLAVTLAAISNEGLDGQPEARVTARLRIPLPAAASLADLLKQMTQDATRMALAPFAHPGCVAGLVARLPHQAASVEGKKSARARVTPFCRASSRSLGMCF